MNRGYNFGAGPAMLPTEILLEAQQELLNWHGSGMSIMEIGHRTNEFLTLIEEAEHRLRRLLNIPYNYYVLFLGGAARTQFSMIPMNLLKKGEQAGFFLTGIWSTMAYEETKKLKQAYVIASSEPNGFTSIPKKPVWQFKENTSYIYYTPNETINGIRFPIPPKHNNIPLIADMTSCLLAEPINIDDYGLIFAGAQKNIANSGLTVVIIRQDLVEKIKHKKLPTMLDFRVHVENKSVYATPPTFNCYLALKMFKWIEDQGGVEALYKQNCEKAAKFYNYIDNNPFYQCKIAKDARSILNICFTLSHKELEEKFLVQAAERGLLALRGHRTVGGLRASMYNSMPLEGVERLIEFMSDFAKGQSL
ncbi:3-phosphoserine/phosphohydroxythreonine transaminase [Legionella gresilensis]|uniref:3-phosphoserine/phosphohydroxythreonine transaminase n=1 Tax=Legionella gresilensis TaxID=91823 RepID=UPI001041A1DA|nr:3-phosphoserine/phosphohydroxythreonine transaminase [Legionella gresilensis]